MPDALRAILDQAADWLRRAQAAGWLDATDANRLAAVEHATPADLFAAGSPRPLVVAFFGGTGVGKSSLLNRLAQAEIARTGVERPTSREVTLYVHESIKLAELPPDLPLDRIHVRRHAAAAHRDILWIDAPDINSTEETNRQAALAWLPHIDLVVYVVSPERYRDDVGWRLLRDRGHRHGWAFIMNRWDEGDRRQADDFRTLLRQAGFDDPLLLRTCCLPGRCLPSPEEFDQLGATLLELLAAHGGRELERLGHRARLQDLRRVLETADRKLGDDARWQSWRQEATRHWESTAATIRNGLEWSARAAAERFATRDPHILATLAVRLTKPTESGAATTDSPSPARTDTFNEVADSLWDAWCDAKLAGWMDAVELVGRRAGVTVDPLRKRLDTVAAMAREQIAPRVEDSLRAALARPGTALGRLARRVTGFLMACLPAAALVWVAWKVVEGYYFAGRDGKQFLGGDFAIHSGLLVLLGWAVPFTVDRLLRPSMRRAALRGIQAGLEGGLRSVGASLLDAMNNVEQDALSRHEEAQRLQRGLTGMLIRPVDARTPAVARLVSTGAQGR